jgi:hypothetical protein
MVRIRPALIAIAACSCSVPLTEAGSRVRQIQPGWGECEFLGVVEGKFGGGTSTAEDQIGAMNTLRNKVAEVGGNAYAITQRAADDTRAVVQADAYRCP